MGTERQMEEVQCRVSRDMYVTEKGEGRRRKEEGVQRACQGWN